VKPVAGIPKTIFTVSLRYQDIEIGTGADAVPNKLYKILYTGYRASDGAIFDSTDKHPRAPVLGQDGKPMLDPDGKPIQGPAQPISLPVGVGNAIIGFDQGFAGMKVGGKRRIFIPWQLAYGVRAMPDRGPDSPGIPPKSDLIFDVQLVDMTEIPAPPARPGAGMAPGMHPMPGGHPAAGTPPAPGTPTAPPAPGTAPKPTAPPTPTAAPAPTSAPAPAPAPTPTPAPTQQK
jgi:peptidylprolyl isomerase